jgi:hypothetical protein
LVDKSALADIPPQERRRQEVSERCIGSYPLIYIAFQAIFELIATEITYVRDLQLIVEVRFAICYGTGLTWRQTFYSSMMPLLDRKAITVVFANIEDILLTNTVSAPGIVPCVEYLIHAVSRPS